MTLRLTYSACFWVLVLILTAGASLPMWAQDAGPMKPPESTKFPTPPPTPKPEPPPIDPEEIVRRFAAKEDEMFRAIAGYTFQKSVRLEEVGPDNKATGQVEMVTQQLVTPDGKVYEKPVRRSASTLHYLDLQRGDSDVVVATPMFALTTSQLPHYEISFKGKQPLDELSAYFFSVKPRALDRAHPYFSGVVWVDEQDLVIVKTIGKWVTEFGDVTSPVLPFAVFETYRQQVGKNLWFPAYSRSDETASVGDARVPIRMIIRWTDYTPLGSQPAVVTPSSDKPAAGTAKPDTTSNHP